MRRSSLALGSVALLLVAAGCGGNVGTSSSADPHMPSGGGTGDDDDDGGTEQPLPAQLAITRFEVAPATTADPYEPNDAQAFYLGGYGFQYTVDDAMLSPTTLRYTVEVTNTGAAVASPFNVEFFRNAPAPPQNQLGDVRQEIPSLDAGASAEVVFEVADAEPGQPQSWSVADVSNVVPETDETDNVSAGLPAEVALDVDVYSVFQTAGYGLEVRLDQLPADYDLEILSPSGAVLARSQNDGTAAETLNGTVSADGRYQIRVYGYAGARSAQPYRLVVTVP